MGLGPKMIYTKFHPNPLTFKTTSWEKTDERRLTPQQYGGRLATGRRALPPLEGSLHDRVGGIGGGGVRTTLKKGTTSLRSVVKKLLVCSGDGPFLR